MVKTTSRFPSLRMKSLTMARRMQNSRSKSQPLVSAIIPTYNAKEFLSQAVRSALDQTYPNIEVIVVDDGSTDQTRELVKSYSPKLHYVYREHSGLPSVVRNAGLRVAQGEYVAFLDSDDQWLPGKLERQVEILERHPAIGLVSANALSLVPGRNTGDRLYLRDEQPRSGWVLEMLLKDNFVVTSTVMIRHSLLNRVGVFSEDPLLRVGEDYDLWLRIATVAEVCYLPEALAIYRDCPEASIRSQQSRSFYWQGMLLILGRLKRCLVDWGRKDLVPSSVLDELTFTYRRALCDAYWTEARYLDVARCWVGLLGQEPTRAIGLGCRKIAGKIIDPIARKHRRR